MLWREGERVLVLSPDETGELLLRFRVVREVREPRERLALDPLGELARVLGLSPCPYHPGIYTRNGACPACAEAAQEGTLERVRER